MGKDLIQELIEKFDMLLDYTMCMQSATKYKNGIEVDFTYLARLSNSCKKDLREDVKDGCIR